MGQVLVLNASYEPLNITTWRRAVVMMLKGKAEGLEHDPCRQLRQGTHLPTVIRLRQYVRVPFRQLPLTRRNLFQRDNHTCQYCGSNAETVDHVVPRSRGGRHTWDNVVAACRRCNGGKRDRLLGETTMRLASAPGPPRPAVDLVHTDSFTRGSHQRSRFRRSTR